MGGKIIPTEEETLTLLIAGVAAVLLACMVAGIVLTARQKEPSGSKEKSDAADG